MVKWLLQALQSLRPILCPGQVLGGSVTVIGSSPSPEEQVQSGFSLHSLVKLIAVEKAVEMELMSLLEAIPKMRLDRVMYGCSLCGMDGVNPTFISLPLEKGMAEMNF